MEGLELISDDVLLNEILTLFRDINEILVLRLVCKSWCERFTLLLPAVVEISLIEIEKIKNYEIFAQSHMELEKFRNMKILFDFKLKKLERVQLFFHMDQVDFCLGRAMIALCEEKEHASNREVEAFLGNGLVKKLQNVSPEKISSEMYEVTKSELIQTLQILGPVDETQRKIIEWITGTLKLYEIASQLNPYFNDLYKMMMRLDYLQSKVKRISRFFGFSGV